MDVVSVCNLNGLKYKIYAKPIKLAKILHSKERNLVSRWEGIKLFK
ncbi:hypothetical protein RHECNPAF_9300160 [Rhizobium etli CNPAF512]|nr:hypothetical protein RHECNPAF_9300160 [Rhizobium etli CNPAF512]